MFRSVCDSRQSRTRRKSEQRSMQSRRRGRRMWGPNIEKRCRHLFYWLFFKIRGRRMWGPSTERRWKFSLSFSSEDCFFCILLTFQWLPQTQLNHSSTRSRSLRSHRQKRNLRRRTKRTDRGNPRSIQMTRLHVSLLLCYQNILLSCCSVVNHFLFEWKIFMVYCHEQNTLIIN